MNILKISPDLSRRSMRWPCTRFAETMPPSRSLLASWSCLNILVLLSLAHPQLPPWRPPWHPHQLNLMLASSHICTYKQTKDRINIHLYIIHRSDYLKYQHIKQITNIPQSSKTSPGGNSISGSP
jgi:hypothetical protein